MKKIIYIIVLSFIIGIGLGYYLNKHIHNNDVFYYQNAPLLINENQEIKYKENLIVLNQDERMMFDLLGQLTLEEKIGQLILSGVNGTSITKQSKALIQDYHIGGVILFSDNITTSDQTVQFLNDIKKENEKNMLPLLLGVDQEGGRVQRLPSEVDQLPSSKEIGAQNDEQFNFNFGALLGTQMQSFGFNLNFAPVLDVHSHPNNPVIGDRSFSTNPESVSTLGIQTMKGIASEGIIPVVKHFPGHGDTSTDSHVELPIVDKSETDLHALELIPFKRAIEAGADMVMTAHILLPQIDASYPATMSEEIMTNMLRTQLEFAGVVITDDMTMQAISDHYSVTHAAVQAIKSGVDIILIAHGHDTTIEVFNKLITAVENGELTEARIDESVARIISLKQKYELKDKETKKVNIKELNKQINKVLR